MVFVSDTFTDTNGTNLSSHTGEVGATWTKHSSYTGNITIQSNRCVGPADGGDDITCYYASGSPTTAEYDVTATLIQTSDDAYSGCSVAGRISTSANTMYLVQRKTGATDQWELYKIVAGSATLLGTWSEALANGDSRTVKLEIRNATKKLYVNGAERISSADNEITGAGKAGTRAYGNDMELDDFSASDPVGIFVATVMVF